MIKFHPNNATLMSFVDGTLPLASSLVISAHCDMCSICGSKTNLYTRSTAQTILQTDQSNDLLERDFVCMFDFITRDSTLVNTTINNTNKHWVTINGRRFTLPPTLVRFSSRIGEWSHLVGKLWHAPIDIGTDVMAQLVYMEKGGSVPEHTHKGNEISLVLGGQFEDLDSTYIAGDYIALNQSHTHMPKSNATEGCLIITILDKPLHFTAGWAKLINPLSHLYFKTQTS